MQYSVIPCEYADVHKVASKLQYDLEVPPLRSSTATAPVIIYKLHCRLILLHLLLWVTCVMTGIWWLL